MSNFLSQNVLSSDLISEDKRHLIAGFITWRREVAGIKMETFQDFLEYASSPEKINLGTKRMALHRHTMCAMLEIFCKNNSEDFKKFLDLIPMKPEIRKTKKRKHFAKPQDYIVPTREKGE